MHILLIPAQNDDGWSDFGDDYDLRFFFLMFLCFYDLCMSHEDTISFSAGVCGGHCFAYMA